MSLLLTFMELDKLYESTMSRQACIDQLKSFGKNYNFDGKSDAVVFRIWEKEAKKQDILTARAEAEEAEPLTCAECGRQLTDGGICPICDDGEEDY